MEKGIVNIHLVEFPILNSCNSEKCSDYDHLSYGSKSFCIVNSFSLMIPKDQDPGFVAFYITIGLVFDLVHPLTSKGFLSLRQIRNFPSPIGF